MNKISFPANRSEKRTNHSKSSSRGRHSSASSHRSSSPAPRTTQTQPPRSSGSQSSKRSKESPLTARLDSKSAKRSSPAPQRNSPAISSAKDQQTKHANKYKGVEVGRKGDRRSEDGVAFPYSVNNNSNNEPSPNVRNVTVSNTHQSRDHRRTGNKGPSYSFNRVAEKKCSRDPPPQSAASSDSDSSDDEGQPMSSDSSSASDSEAEDKAVFVRSASPLPPSTTAKSSIRDRSNSSSSKQKYPKMDLSQSVHHSLESSPVKKQTGVKSKSRRSAPVTIPRQEQVDGLRAPHQDFTKQNVAVKDKNEHSKKSYHSSPSEGQPRQQKAKHKSSKPPVKPSPNFQDNFPSLWVRLNPDSTSQKRRDDHFSPAGGDTRTKAGDYGRYRDSRSHVANLESNNGDRFSRLPTLSTGSETEQPIRRAESVQVNFHHCIVLQV